MQKILDVAYSNANSIESIMRDVFALIVGFGVPIFVFLFFLLFIVSLFLIVTEGIINSLIARKDRLKEKVALLDNGDTTPSID